MYSKQLYFLFSVGISLIVSNTLWFTENQPPKDLNSLPPEETTIQSNFTPPITSYETKQLNDNGGINYLTLKESGKSTTYNLYKAKWKLDDFTLNFPAKEKDYETIKTDEINISLFTNPAWNSSSKNDEYSKKLTPEEIKELFNVPKNHKPIKPNGVEDLRSLKIKYFSDFNSLKSYVLEKVKTCTNPNKSCVAKVEELGIMEQDKLSFFDV